jgi:putative addiction module killer protein
MAYIKKRLNVALMPDIMYSMILIKKTTEFTEWLDLLTWKEQAQVHARLKRIQDASHFGDAKSLGNGLAELRWKNGWRIYFFKEGRDMIVLLVGGHKNAQEKDIQKARLLLRRYAHV